MKRTNTKEFRETVFAYLCESLYDFEGTREECAAEIWRKFSAEYDYPDNRRRTPNTQARVAEWLSGLPLNIDYTNGDIIDTSERWHECTFNDKMADKIVANWFNFLAFQLLKLWEANGINPHVPHTDSKR